MGRITFFSSAIIVALLTCAPTPASAEQHTRSRGAAPSRGAAVARVAPRHAVVARPHVIVAPRRIVPVAPFRFVRPYDTFRPRVSLGFGLWVGYPVAFPYYYGAYPYPYPCPYPAYPYPAYAYPSYPYSPPAGAVGVQSGAPNTGGVSFETTPSDGDIYVDGEYAGRVSDFGPMSQPLSVTPGRHTIEIRRAGYQDLTFDADVPAGQVVPYQGTMQRR